MTVQTGSVLLKRASKLPTITASTREALLRVQHGYMQAARAADIAADAIRLRRLTLPAKDRPFLDHPIVCRTLKLIRDLDVLGLDWQELAPVEEALRVVSDQMMRASLDMANRVPVAVEEEPEPDLRSLVLAILDERGDSRPSNSYSDSAEDGDSGDSAIVTAAAVLALPAPAEEELLDVA